MARNELRVNANMPQPGSLSRRLSTLLIAAVAMNVVMGVMAVSAVANVSHVFSTTFASATSNPPDPYPISQPTDVAVDQASHDLYVTDSGNHRVEKFTEDGEFLFMFGKEVNKTAVETVGRASEENVCPAPGHFTDKCQSGVAAESPGGFETPTYLAVDNFVFGEGDVYVGDTGDNVVTKFNAAGEIVSSWGVAGQKDGSDDPHLPKFGALFGLAVGGGCQTPTAPKVGTCHANGTLYVGGRRYGDNVREYTQDGEWIGDSFSVPGWLKVNPAGRLFYIESPFGTFGSQPVAWMNILKPGTPGEGNQYQMTTDWPASGLALDPSTEELYTAVETRGGEEEPHGVRIDHFSSDCNPVNGPCEPIDSFGEGDLSAGKEACVPGGYGNPFECTIHLKGVAVDGANHSVYVVNSSSEANSNDIAVFKDVRPIVTTGPPSAATTSSVTLTGHVDPAGRGEISECFFEYGFDKTYGSKVPCTPPIPPKYSGSTAVTAAVSGLSPGTHEHYRLVATNTAGATSFGVDETFTTTAPPAIDGLISENLTAHSAELIAQVNPNGLPTKYSFEYGSSSAFDQKITGTIPAGTVDQEIKAQLTGLIPHVVYHFRLTAENKIEGKEEGGTTTSEEQTFNFYPPSCPNENVRQQTKTNFLPDCRAYELVSPGDANGTQLFAGGPNSGYASNPPRFAYTGLFSIIPGSGGSPIDGSGDLYVATRTDTGWTSRYVGLPSTEAAVDGGPPQGLFGQGGAEFLGNDTSITNGDSGPDHLQNNVLTDPSMSTFLDWNDGSQEGHSRNSTPISSNAPYVWSANGGFIDRWPTNLGSVPPGLNPTATEGGVSPGGVHSLDCPDVRATGGFEDIIENNCPGEVSASSDLSHFVFSTEWNLFASDGNLTPPGSVYDNNTKTGSVVVASLTPGGDAIPSEPADHAGDPLQIPGVSDDGSHVLIGAGAIGPCGLTNCPIPPCGDTFGGKIHCPTYPMHLYMRVDGAVTYDVSQGHDVTYVGMTKDATKVFFTSPEQLTSEDHDGSVDLYMWTEAGEREGQPLTLISKSNNNKGIPGEPGQSDACKANFSTPGETTTKNCDIVTFSSLSWCQLEGGGGGNCRSDSAIASEEGDIYFFSPEQLDGSLGIPNKENLYVYRTGAQNVQLVATLEPGQFCIAPTAEGIGNIHCSSTPVPRMQVSPDGAHMAFLTASPVTQYNNGGRLEMYLYDPASDRVVCASCIPSGAPPTSNVGASQDGLFMTNDGRVFFTTNDALVHADTNEAQDVYEYVDGRPQLITTGTGDTRAAKGGISTVLAQPGLDGVSADGRDVYFSSFDTLTSQDHNGLFLKFYDARSGGGFPAPAPPPPCEAADECHGAGSAAPSPMQIETGATLAGGNGAAVGSRRRHRRKQRREHRPIAGRAGKSKPKLGGRR